MMVILVVVIIRFLGLHQTTRQIAGQQGCQTTGAAVMAIAIVVCVVGHDDATFLLHHHQVLCQSQ